MMPYIFHKTVIVVYAVIMLILNNNFVVTNFSSSFRYMYMGVGLSIAIIVFMILCVLQNGFIDLYAKYLMRHLERHVLKKLMKNQDTDCSFKGSNSKDYQKAGSVDFFDVD